MKLELTIEEKNALIELLQDLEKQQCMLDKDFENILKKLLTNNS